MEGGAYFGFNVSVAVLSSRKDDSGKTSIKDSGGLEEPSAISGKVLSELLTELTVRCGPRNCK